MKLTNHSGAPDAYFRACVNDPYNRGDSLSPSLLNTPPRAIVLIERHGDEIEIDVSTKVAATIGQGAHSILERAKREGIDIVEVRFKRTLIVDDVAYTISAQLDLFETDTGTLSDWKTTKTYAFHKKTGRGKKPEWTSQMNIGRWVMAAQSDLPEVKRMQIVGLLKDWDRRKAQTEDGYPESEIMVSEVPMWTFEETEAWITERIRAINAARKELPLCTLKETWGGNRCKGGWCEAAAVCEQFKQLMQTGVMPTAKEQK